MCIRDRLLERWVTNKLQRSEPRLPCFILPCFVTLPYLWEWPSLIRTAIWGPSGRSLPVASLGALAIFVLRPVRHHPLRSVKEQMNKLSLLICKHHPVVRAPDLNSWIYKFKSHAGNRFQSFGDTHSSASSLFNWERPHNDCREIQTSFFSIATFKN